MAGAGPTLREYQDALSWWQAALDAGISTPLAPQCLFPGLGETGVAFVFTDIFAVRRSPGGRSAWEALVCWSGPFDPEWLPSRDLCWEAKKEAQHLIRLEACHTSSKRKAEAGPSSPCGPSRHVRRSPRLVEREATDTCGEDSP